MTDTASPLPTPPAKTHEDASRDHGHHRHGFFAHWLHHLPVILGLTVAVAVIAHLGWLDSFQSMALDAFLLAQRSRQSDHIVLVTIGDLEFSSLELFNATSPLDPAKVGEVLEAIKAGRPRLIVVDLDTSAVNKKDQYQRLAEKTTGADWPPVIWSCDGDVESDGHSGHGAPVVRVMPPLAGNPAAHRGLSMFPADSDGVVRRYYRTFQTAAAEDEHGSHHAIDSLPWAAVKEYCRQAPEQSLPEHLRRLRGTSAADTPSPNELLMNFPGDRFNFFRIAAATALGGYRKMDFWNSDKSPIRDKIVVLGGTYRAARDNHPTPLGQVPGAVLLATVIETELENRGIRFTHEALAILVDILFASLLVYLNWWFPSPRAMWWNLLAVAVLALFASYLTFNTLGFWLNFAVVLTGVWQHIQFDMMKQLPQLHDEVQTLRAQLKSHEDAGQMLEELPQLRDELQALRAQLKAYEEAARSAQS
jgi:CHASE2 domain-containing sensor protein